MDILGLVENMSGLLCPHCGQGIDLFKVQGGRLTAEKEGLRLLGTFPIEPRVVESSDDGSLVRLVEDQLPFIDELKKMVGEIEKLTA